jgi:Bacterial alpha-L-rhamnosidase C-terminal domain/Bacterial alpha-L-rhamnosidase 6 hairpin glycosidase domain
VAQDDVGVLREMIVWFASVQNGDGSIPASPFHDRALVLIDYNAYWIETLYDYVLYTGDLALLRQVWPALVKVVDDFYPGHVAGGLLVNWLGPADYAYIPRGGTRVAYYNAQYVRALRLAAALAGWNGDGDRAARWTARAGATAAVFGDAFWDAGAGAFRDTAVDTAVHPLDGNAFALLAGLASPAQAQSVLTYIDGTMWQSYGNSVADADGWHGSNWGDGDHVRVYPFVSYFEVAARFSLGADASALELIRREWGFMATRNPGTMWETIASATGGTVDNTPSWSHGWSSGAAPALTAGLLGVQPTSPGFATFTVTPHPGGVESASGTVPTPHGALRVSWRMVGGRLALEVGAPPGTVWENDPSRTTAKPAATGTVAPAAAKAATTATAKRVAGRLGKGLRLAWRGVGAW